MSMIYFCDIILLATLSIYVTGQTEYFKLKQEDMHVATFDQLRIAKFYPKQALMLLQCLENVCVLNKMVYILS